MARVIAVSLGTDHHRFDRLMDWLQEWYGRNGDVELRIQHGYTQPFSGPINREILPHSELVQWFREADTLVLQGGPGGILDALNVGKTPIVIPRLAKFHEVVDDHQVAFCRRLADRGYIQVADSADQLCVELDRAEFLPPPPQLVGDGPTQVKRLLTDVPAPLPAGRRRTRLQEIWLTRRRADRRLPERVA